MSRKAFLIWGILIISTCLLSVPLVQYLAFSKIIDIKAVARPFAIAQIILPIVGFGVLLSIRFKEIGRRKRITALCLVFYVFSLTMMIYPAIFYFDQVVMKSGAQTRFFKAIGEWYQTHPEGTDMSWTVKQKLDYILVMLPSQLLANWSLFVLLWFGSLDPRTPSKNSLVQFFKTGFHKKRTTSLPQKFETAPAA